MIDGEAVIAEARTWVGTPFAHQGRSRRGVDCVGLIFVVAWALGVGLRNVTDYGRMPRPARMRAALDEQLERVAIGAAERGDIFWIAWRTDPQHLAFYTGRGLIHGYQSAGAVVEHDISPEWSGRVRAAYRIPGD